MKKVDPNDTLPPTSGRKTDPCLPPYEENETFELDAENLDDE